MKKTVDIIIYYVALVASYPVQYLSPKMRVVLGKLLGRFFMLLMQSRVEIALDNLSKAFPNKNSDSLKIIAKQSFENLGITLLDILAMKHLSKQKIINMVKFENLAMSKKLLAQNRGMILLSAHFGNWEISAMSGALQMAVEYLIIVEHQANDFINTEINRIRTRFGNKVVSRYAAAREIVKVLRRGEVLALIADQSASERNDVYVDFFGRPAATFDSPAALALKFDIPVVFGVSVRQADGSYIVSLKQIQHDDLKYDKAGILELTRRHVKILENEIIKNPGHWAWMHRRWKHSPPEEYVNG